MTGTDGDAPTRVAFVAGSLDRGGAEKQLIYMVRQLRRAGVEVCVCVVAGGGALEYSLRELGVSPLRVGPTSTRLGRIGVLYRILREFRPDVVHAVHFHLTPYVVVVARLLGALAVAGVRNDGHRALSELGWVGPWILRLPDGIVANSHSAERNLARLGARRPVRVVPNVIDVAEFDSLALAPSVRVTAMRTVIGVGRLVPVKGFDRFLRVLQLVQARRPDVRGVIVGDGPERRRLEQLAAQLRLVPDGVRFVGERADVPDLLRASDLLLLTSRSEGFPNVVLEAMVAARPVVTTDVGDAATVVEHRVTGYVVSASLVEQLARRVIALVDSLDLRDRFGAAGRRRVEERYGVEGLAERLLTAYQEIARVRRPWLARRFHTTGWLPCGNSDPCGPVPTLERVGTGERGLSGPRRRTR